MSLIERVSKMDDDAFERWMRRNGYTGLAAFRLSRARRAAIKETRPS
jgi:hypothetical protein